MSHSSIRNNISTIKLRKLIVAAIVIGFASSFLAIALKKMTEHYESVFFNLAENTKIYFVLFPLLGLSFIYLLREYLFKKKPNKGITEIFESTESKKKNLPLYKIPSHVVNGFLTVVFGGSTGIEVSTVVASATIGSVVQQKANFFREYKTELICAGVAAGITALFGSPIAGILFALEVISRKLTKVFALVTILAVAVATGLEFLIDDPAMFNFSITTWNYYAIPYFIVLGILAGLHSVYLTKCVLFFKERFSQIVQHYNKIIIATLLLGTALLWLPALYGDGYHAIRELIEQSQPVLTMSLALTLVGILILKPIVTSATLASGGDGGVFAPSLFTGAALGFLVAVSLNTFFDANVIIVNFMVIGMAAMLSAAIHAPFTALFLVCGITGNYILFFPLLTACVVSKYTAKMVYPHTVYTFSRAK